MAREEKTSGAYAGTTLATRDHGQKYIVHSNPNPIFIARHEANDKALEELVRARASENICKTINMADRVNGNGRASHAVASEASLAEPVTLALDIHD